MSKVIGIDLGNKNCVIAVPDDQSVHIIENESYNRISPSMVTYTNDRRFGGELAHQNQMSYYKTTITNLKYLIGMKYDSDERRQVEAICAYELAELDDGNVGVKVQFKDSDLILRPEQCVTFLLKDLIEMANKEKPEAKKCVISVSPWWSHYHRRSLLNSVKIGNIDCLSLVNSTTAAAVAYVKIHGEKLPPKEARPVPVMFIDMGDYSMNVVIALVKQNYVQIKAYAYDDHLGGALFTAELIPYLLARTLQKYKIDPRQNPRAWLRFQDAAEKLKKTLSINPSVPFEVPSLMNDIDVSFLVKRDDFNARIKQLIARIEDPIMRALGYADLKKEDLYAIESLGGGARVVAAKEKIAEILGREPTQTLNIDECFAIGAAIIAQNLSGEKKDLVVIDAAPNEIFANYVDGEDHKQEVLFKKFAPVPSEAKVTIPVDGHSTIKVESTFCPIGTVDLTLSNGAKADVEVTFCLSSSSYIHFKSANVVGEENKPEVNVTFSFAGDLTESKLEEFKKLEDEMEECDENEKKIDNIKNDLEGAIFEAENGINRDFPDFFEPTELIKFKKEVEDIHEWFTENEFDRFPLEEYQTRLDAIKSVLDPAKGRCLKYNALNDEVSPIKDQANELLVAVKTDADRIDGGEKEALQKDVEDFLEDIDKALAEPKYQENKHTSQEFVEREKALEIRLESLKKLPTKVEVAEQQKRQTPKPSRIQTPDEEEEEIKPAQQQPEPQQQQPMPQEEAQNGTEEEREDYPSMEDLLRDFWGHRFYGSQPKQEQKKREEQQPKPAHQKPQPKKEEVHKQKPAKIEEPVEDNYYYDKYGHIIGIKPREQHVSEEVPQQKPKEEKQIAKKQQTPVVTEEPQDEEEDYYDPFSFFFGYPPRRSQRRNNAQRQKKERQNYRSQEPSDYRRPRDDYQYYDDDDFYQRRAPKAKKQARPEPEEVYDNPFDEWKASHQKAVDDFNRRRREQEEEERRLAEKRARLEEEERKYMEQKRREVEQMKRRAAQQQLEAERNARRNQGYDHAGPGFDFWNPYYAPSRQYRQQEQQRPSRGRNSYYPSFGYPFFW